MEIQTFDFDAKPTELQTIKAEAQALDDIPAFELPEESSSRSGLSLFPGGRK